MRQDEIDEIEVDGQTLFIKPKSEKFPYIYREAKCVKWNPERAMLSMSVDPSWEWDLLKCYRQILSAVKEQSCLLQITEKTIWKNVDASLKALILAD